MPFFVSARFKGLSIRPPPENHSIHHPLLPWPPSGPRGARAATDGRLSARCGTVLANAWSDEAHLGLYPCVRAMTRMMVCGMLLSGAVCRI